VRERPRNGNGIMTPVGYQRDEAEITTGQILNVDSGVTIYWAARDPHSA
jgi:hypothetical protein